MFKDKKNITIFLLLIIIIILVIVGVIIFITKNKNLNNSEEILVKTMSINNKIFNIGDEITKDELRSYYKNIYDNYTLLGTALTADFNNFDYPYINTAHVYSDNIIEVFGISNTKNPQLSLCAQYKIDSDELITLNVNIFNGNNELISKMTQHIGAFSTIIDNDKVSTYNIYNALLDNSEEQKIIYNTFKKVSWIIQKDSDILDDNTKVTHIYLTRDEKLLKNYYK